MYIGPTLSLCVAVFSAGDFEYSRYYFDEERALTLNDHKIAILADTSEQLDSVLREYNLSGDLLEPLPISGWSILDISSTRAVNMNTVVNALAHDARLSFVSPVFVDDNGGPLIATKELLLAFHGDVARERQDAILRASFKGTIIDQDWAGMSGAYRLRSTSTNGFDVIQVANSLALLPEVRFAEANFIFTGRGSHIPNDPGFVNCWGIHNTGQTGGTPDMDMDGPEAWDVSLGEPDIRVVILDSGVQLDHPDLASQIIPGFDSTSDGPGDGGPVNPCDNHGTPVAGCVAATIDNGIGTVGIAPHCTIASARTFISDPDCDDIWYSQTDWTVQSLAWAQQEIGARVSNNSNGYGFQSSAIALIYEVTRSRGMVHFASAGNDSMDDITYPASLPTVNAVAALDHDGELTAFSNYGPGLAFSAPGLDIYTTDRTGSAGWSPGDYATVWGTSFASPYAAGIAALILSIDPTQTAGQVESILQLSSLDLGQAGYDETFGWGFVNANAALFGESKCPTFDICSIVVDDSSQDCGNGDGTLQSGENVEIRLQLHNTGKHGTTFIATDVDVSIDRIAGVFDCFDTHSISYPDMPAQGECMFAANPDNSWSICVPRSVFGSFVADVIVDFDHGCAPGIIPSGLVLNIEPASWIDVTPSTYDFGVAGDDNVVMVPLTVKNDGSMAMEVTGILTESPAVTWDGPTFPFMLAPDQSIEAALELTLLDGMQLGSFEHTVCIQSDALVCADSDDDCIQIVGFVAQGIPTFVVEEASPIEETDIGGGIIVWAENRFGGKFSNDIFGYDLATGTELEICVCEGSQSWPRTDGQYVAWEDYRDDPLRANIYAADLTTGQVFPVATDAFHEDIVGVVDGNIAFTRVFHEFTEPHNGSDPRNVLLFDIEQRIESAITTFQHIGHSPMHSSSHFPVDVDACDGRVVWHEFTFEWHDEFEVWEQHDHRVMTYVFGSPSPQQIWTGYTDAVACNCNEIVVTADTSEIERQVWRWLGGTSWRRVTLDDRTEHGNEVLAVGCDVAVYNQGGSHGLYATCLDTGEQFFIPPDIYAWDWSGRMDEHSLVWATNPGVLRYAFLKEADISVSGGGIVTSTESPYLGEPFDVSVTVTNIAPWETDDKVVVSLLQKGDSEEEILIEETTVTGFGASQSTNVQFPDISVSTVGDVELCVHVVVPSGDNPSNNKACKSIAVTQPPAWIVPIEFRSISDAIDAAIASGVPDAVIEVSPGIYEENIDLLGGPVKIIAVEGPVETIINGRAIGSVVTAVSGETSDTIVQGFTITGGSAFSGGGLHLQDSSPTFIDCIIKDNQGTIGGAMNLISNCSPRFINCEIVDNHAKNRGGAMANSFSAPLFVNCLIAGNSAGIWAGAVSTHESAPEFVNCTFTGNMSPDVGCLRIQGGKSDVELTSCILWGNSDVDGSDESAQIEFAGGASTTNLNINYSCVQGWTGTLGGEGNVGLNPLLADVLNDDFRLLCGSPCVDAGDSGTVPSDDFDVDGDGDVKEFIPIDLAGQPRFVDDPLTKDAGLGTPPIIDMGAYEYQPSDRTCPADLTCDGEVGPQDLAQILGNWGPCDNCDACPADLTGDCVVGPQDLAQILGNWGPC